MTISAKIIADTIHADSRITTFVLRYPRFIHSEFMTHRVFSRNASSSRAIPVEKSIRDVLEDPAIPVHWGLNKKGMQADTEVEDTFKCRDQWLKARDSAVANATAMATLGLHKQIVNRVLEPFSHISVVCTSTEYNNFFKLRCHPDAQPEIRTLAEMMRIAYATNVVNRSDVHIPFVSEDEYKGLDLVSAMQCSVARCARVSYLNHDNSAPNVDKDIDLFKKLSTSGHWSPFEHMAFADSFLADAVADRLGLRWNLVNNSNFNKKWIQFRKLFPQESGNGN